MVCTDGTVWNESGIAVVAVEVMVVVVVVVVRAGSGVKGPTATTETLWSFFAVYTHGHAILVTCK